MEISTKPYFLRAIYEWCVDSGFTPYISVKVDSTTRVPTEYVKGGEIVLNISAQATRNLTMSNEAIQFSARFNGSSREISIPVERVAGVFARENGHGAFFQVEESVSSVAQPEDSSAGAISLQLADVPSTSDGLPDKRPDGPGRPRLKVVK
jgi:stringent starvation protein B